MLRGKVLFSCFYKVECGRKMANNEYETFTLCPTLLNIPMLPLSSRIIIRLDKANGHETLSLHTTNAEQV